LSGIKPPRSADIEPDGRLDVKASPTNGWEIKRLKRQYAAAWSTLCQARYGILMALLAYTASCVGGWFFAEDLGFFHQAAAGLADKFEGRQGADFILSLFLHNLVATYIAMCLVSLWGLFPMVNAIANGLILGWIVGTAYGPSPVDAAVMLVPHGLFEWPAMMIAWGVGLWRGAGYRFSSPSGTYLHRLKQSNQLFFLYVFPLLVVAAVVEGRSHLLDLFPG
jgi:stage II sporulation protein M